MESFDKIDGCPRCGFPIMTSWNDLSDDDRFAIELLLNSTAASAEERKKHRFCKRCWFEDRGRGAHLA
jgi:ribosomal protein S27AE